MELQLAQLILSQNVACYFIYCHCIFMALILGDGQLRMGSSFADQ